MNRKLQDHDLIRLADGLAEGLSCREVAARLGVSAATAIRWTKRWICRPETFTPPVSARFVDASWKQCAEAPSRHISRANQGLVVAILKDASELPSK